MFSQEEVWGIWGVICGLFLVGVWWVAKQKLS